MLLEITDEIADQVVLNALKESIECVSQSISELEQLDKLKEYQVADLFMIERFLKHWKKYTITLVVIYNDYPC